MTSSNIDNIVIFKKHLGLNLEIDQSYVGLTMMKLWNTLNVLKCLNQLK